MVEISEHIRATRYRWRRNVPNCINSALYRGNLFMRNWCIRLYQAWFLGRNWLGCSLLHAGGHLLFVVGRHCEVRFLLSFSY